MTISLTLPYPDSAGKWSERDRQFLRDNHGKMPLKALESALHRSAGSIRAQVTVMGLAKQVLWTAAEEAALVEMYSAAGDTGVVRLSEFAIRIGREKGNVCRKAKALGLTTNRHRKTVDVRKVRLPKFATEDERRANQSVVTKRRLQERGHPRGMLGKKHPASALLKISAASKAQQLFLTDEQRQARVEKAMRTKIERYGAVNAGKVKRGSWAAGWREIGGKRNYYRSRWEANYGRYLQWLKELGQIADWQHEPETFWFEQIKRGTRSYLPDFRVWENDGSTALHEVKGWMDQRSRTTLSRMKKYHPQEEIVLIDGNQYRAIRLKVLRLVPGWEDSPRDTHA
jgi:hypothetical protein